MTKIEALTKIVLALVDENPVITADPGVQEALKELAEPKLEPLTGAGWRAPR